MKLYQVEEEKFKERCKRIERSKNRKSVKLYWCQQMEANRN
ncbi:unnamed protein product [Meloidogyne enterolobii]|uniref:Uncharacterized protein n=1 Tax=Meloidogyne enterolobii TaxID=390850 RepID=A0ACB1AYL7_MELEN